ncbi:hypothetical protein GRI39_01900 [Altererythrobacter indicus]|uniref:Uncharacterized protein n=1 Tax=Altericroceibacterium indicum TaxID=374177 RepID=A0A845A618_9SPHN|nr:hypothetical protein [Altericroceibacterium indicum]MXP24799.1 hypothetical protein [Altericroceibacterium indicum]
MIGAFSAAKGLLGLKNWIWIAVIAALVACAFVAVSVVDNALDDVVDTSKQAGASEQREGDLRETMKRVEEGDAVRNNIEREGQRGAGSAIYDQCLRANRGSSENCQRFLPERETDQR